MLGVITAATYTNNSDFVTSTISSVYSQALGGKGPRQYTMKQNQFHGSLLVSGHVHKHSIFLLSTIQDLVALVSCHS